MLKDVNRKSFSCFFTSLSMLLAVMLINAGHEPDITLPYFAILSRTSYYLLDKRGDVKETYIPIYHKFGGKEKQGNP